MDIERYLNIRSAGAPTISPDGDRLAFLLDTTGVPQVWLLDAAESWPDQLTFYDERITFVDYSPTNPEIAFGMDEGGNERQQFYRLDPHNGEVVPLTDRPDAKHRWGGWSHDGSRFAFTSNRRDNAVFDVYVQGRGEHGEAARLLHEGDGWLTVTGWSHDDTRVAVHQAYSNYDQDVSVLDVESGDVNHITPHEGDVRYLGVEWGPTGEAIYLTTDLDADTMYLARLDLESLEIELVYEGGDWNVEGVAVDQDSGRIAFSRNVEGYTDLTIAEFVDETTIEPVADPDLPEGVFGGVSFGPDGDRIAFGGSTSSLNANAYVTDIETGTTTRWTRASTAGISADSFVEPEVVHYESFDGLEIPSYFSRPESDEPSPVIVDIHGGPESQRRPSFNPVKQYFLANGYAVFEPNVRGSTGYGKAYTRLDDKRKRMDSVADIEAGVGWLRDRPDVDPDRIVALGGSYGGFMVLAALTEYPDLWAAGVDVVGIANFITFLENTGDWRRKLREAEYGSLDDDRDFLESISPINTIDKIRAPLLVLHGANDPRVPVGEAEQIAEEAAKHVPVETVIFDDEGHGFSKLENRIEAYRTVVDFLDTHL